MNSLFTSQFNYCHLVWMFHSRAMNNKINHLNERRLRIVYSDKTSSFEKLLETVRSVPIHIKNPQILATDFFKGGKNLVPTIFSEIFSKQSVKQYNLRHASEFFVPNVKITFHGTEIKKWKPQNCPCTLCKKYIKNLGFCLYFFLYS